MAPILDSASPLISWQCLKVSFVTDFNSISGLIWPWVILLIDYIWSDFSFLRLDVSGWNRVGWTRPSAEWYVLPWHKCRLLIFMRWRICSIPWLKSNPLKRRLRRHFIFCSSERWLPLKMQSKQISSDSSPIVSASESTISFVSFTNISYTSPFWSILSKREYWSLSSRCLRLGSLAKYPIVCLYILQLAISMSVVELMEPALKSAATCGCWVILVMLQINGRLRLYSNCFIFIWSAV
jgi:hypothetical protein